MSLLYSAESWLSDSIRPIEQQYNQLVRCLLGVRKNTSIDLCLLEAGIPPVKHVLAKRICKYLSSKLEIYDVEEPFIHIYRLCQANNTPSYKYIQKSLEYDIDLNPFVNLISGIREKALEGSKFNTYMYELNVPLNFHPIYSANVFVPDYLRQSFSRLRLMSHNLMIETGRWSRIPRVARVCQCNNTAIQSENHVLIECSLTQNLRLRYPDLNYRDLSSLLGESIHLLPMCKYIHEVLEFYS